MYKKLSALKPSGAARLEYQCRECGYEIYKPLMGDDIELYLKNWNDYLLLTCPSCSTKTMDIAEIWSEEEWVKSHKYAEG